MRKALVYAFVLEIIVVGAGVLVEKTMGISDRTAAANAERPTAQMAAVAIPVPASTK